VAKQGYLAPNDYGGVGGQVAFSLCRTLNALALMFPPKLSSHKTKRVRLYVDPYPNPTAPQCFNSPVVQKR
jgi:hypothetical protein